MPLQLGFALLLGAVAFAGAGGGQNLCQSNWIRDKGFGMGQYVPKLVSAVTGEAQAAPTASAFIFEPTEANMVRWRKWWVFANIEQVVTFVFVTVATICLTSMLAHSTLFGRPDLPQTVAFLQIEGRRLQEIVGPWFGVLFWAIGSFSLFASAMGIADYTSRLAADVLKSTYLRSSAVSESRLYFWLVWGLIGLGCSILLIGMDQPLVLLVISASVGRHHDVPLFGVAVGSQPEGAARGDQNSLVPRRGDGVVGRFFRDPRQPDHLAAAEDLAALAAKRASRGDGRRPDH